MGKSSKQRRAASQNRREKRRAQKLLVAEEWIGGWTVLRAHVLEDPEAPYRPIVLIWFSPSHGIVGMEVVSPENVEHKLVELLERSMRAPSAGPPRKPSHIRVATTEIADAVRPCVPDTTEIRIAEIAELEEVFESLHEDFPGIPKDEDSYMESGRIAPEVVERFFSAAFELYRHDPWLLFEEDELIQVDCAPLKVRGQALSIIGAGGEAYGVMVYENAADFHAFRAIAERGRYGIAESPRLPCELFTISFDSVEDLSHTMRLEAMKHRWPVADAQAYPVLLMADRDHLRKPLTRRAYERATVYLEAIAALFDDGISGVLAGRAESADVSVTSRIGSDAEI
ncbi:MAG: hypothetical protein AAF658_15970, partial [Myxococcota bacterium]